MAGVSIAGAASIVLMFGWGLKALVDEGFSAGAAGAWHLNAALLRLLGLALFLSLASFTRFYAVQWLAEKAGADLRTRLFAKLLSLDPGYFETHKTGDEVARITADTSILQMALATNVPIALRHLLTLAGSVVMLAVVSPALTLLVFLAVPAVLAPAVFFARRLRARARDAQGRIGDISAFGQEALQGLQTIQSFGYEAASHKTFAKLVSGVFGAAMRQARLRAGLTAYVISAVFSAITLVLWAGGHKVLSGDLTAGSLSAFLFYAVIAAGAVASLTEAAGAFGQAAGAADRVGELLSRKPTLSGTAEMAGPVKGAVAFEGVTFSYPTRPDSHSLRGVAFTVNPGEVVALAGRSGAGKTTVFQLLQRFYDPQAGRITIDGRDISHFTPASVRRHLAVVAQDPAIFSVSVAENIRMGRPSASEEEVREAARQAQADEFIRALPQGYDTPAGEKGGRLSGGQRQRIAIARAILKNAEILLLDEATSALDAENETAVHAALRNLMKGRTVIVIAHTPSAMKAADRVVFLENGCVTAEGAHASLAAANKDYARLSG